jgi:hypothetical protein
MPIVNLTIEVEFQAKDLNCALAAATRLPGRLGRAGHLDDIALPAGIVRETIKIDLRQKIIDGQLYGDLAAVEVGDRASDLISLSELPVPSVAGVIPRDRARSATEALPRPLGAMIERAKMAGRQARAALSTAIQMSMRWRAFLGRSISDPGGAYPADREIAAEG